MPKIERKKGTVTEINKITYGNDTPRGYLGMSGIGEKCWRKLWYGFHFVVRRNHSAKTQRIFNIGHMFEKLAIDELKKVGCKVYKKSKYGTISDLTGEPGEVQEELLGFAGHSKGHPDGRIFGLVERPNKELLLELKTMNDKRFNAVSKNTVQKSDPVYYAQTQIYMLEMGLDECFFLAINKNNCEYYYEFIELDVEEAKELKRKQEVIIVSDAPPEKAYSSDYYQCSWCDFFKVCHSTQEPDENCRTCEHSDIADYGKWLCSNKVICDSGEYELSINEQVKGCSHWEKGWGL